ncbi:hypothetical protein C2S53_017928 [Perilla frutescens var. hirtella]|uniref:Xyloglucan endotransglucosylase/hydrolase n=1 Tax=Perilla frutescens var. hirtella TaxID=608512 RepID=A0AAD4IY84_PERFH|nr:hypothetical protein C2S53_017928 [Perilla frutescens var. hirtella]
MAEFFSAVVIVAVICSSSNLLQSSEAADQNRITPSRISFNKGFKALYGEANVIPYEDDGSVDISMDGTTSSGFHSRQMYVNGNFETSLKLPSSYTAGVVVTFYTSNNQKYPYRHDEIDFEFLGHIGGKNWTVQTNFYGNGRVDRGREERYGLWFDPSEDYHRYRIRWGPNRITYYVDDVPIRHVRRVPAMGMGAEADFPSKEMRLYGTIWNGSDWATGGGKYKMDLSYGPFVAKYSGFVLDGCPFNETCSSGSGGDVNGDLTREERVKMNGFRRKWMNYSYCYDKTRYAVPLPECVFNSRELRHLQKLHPTTYGH